VLVAIAEPLLADGVADAIRAADDLGLVARPRNGTEAIRLIRELEPQVAIIGCELFEPNCLRALRKIKQENTNLAIIALIGKTAPSYFVQHLQVGVAGWLPKTATGDEVINAIRRVCAGEVVVSLPSMSELMQYLEYATDEQGRFKKGGSLNQVELEILKLASRGLTNKEICQKLFVSERSVQSYFSTIFKKLEVRSRTEAVLAAWEKGWIPLVFQETDYCSLFHLCSFLSTNSGTDRAQG